MNGPLLDKNTIYKVECRYDEDLTGDNFWLGATRNEDATMPCFKILKEEDGYPGVSKEFPVHCLWSFKASCLVKYF